MTFAATRYRENDVFTMSPGHRVVALYSHLLLRLRQARVAIEQRDIPARSAHLGRAMDVLHELLSSLDPEQGGKLADQLAALYVYLIGELAAVDARPGVARLDPVIRIVGELHGAWAAAAQAAPAPGPAPAAG
ncbi:MAG TPA: flagellar export chaperone FliS [Gemmatimonadales bacterium]|nr:flagellar export chaperone FliS [Gemmatimonadales bacterium]